jgi:hypothetical protein
MRHLFVPFALLTTYLIAAGVTLSAESPAQSDIPYSSLEEATAALKAKKGVTFRTQDGWVVAEDLDAFTVWLLTPPNHPAYPSVVKRTIVNGADGASMQTRIRCFASQETCDKFFGGK